MSRSKKLYALLAVLAAVCVATFAASRIEEHKENIKNSDEVVLAIDSATVKSVSWECGSGSYAFTKDDIWTYDDDADFPVSEDKMEELLDVFSEFGVSFVIEDVDDYSQYGLDDPVCTIDIATDDEEYAIKLGDYSTMDEKRYVSTGDGNVYLATVDPVESYDVDISEIIDNDDTPDYDDVLSIAFSGNETATDGNMTEYTLTYSEDGGNSYRDTDVYFTTADGEEVPLDTSDVNSYARTLSYLDLTDYVTYKATDDDLTTYGLLDPELTVTMEYTPTEDADDANDASEAPETQTFAISVSRDPAELAAATEADTEDESSGTDTSSDDADSSSDDTSSDNDDDFHAYLRVGDSPIIYRITEDEYNDLMAYTYYDLRHDEILPVETDGLSQIDITLEGSAYTITAKEDGDDTVWYRGDAEIDSDDLMDALDNLSADSFTTEKATGKEEISIRVHMSTDGDDVDQADSATDGTEKSDSTEATDGMEAADETASSGDAVQITFYRYDGNDCLAVIDGKATALVARSLVVDLIEAVNAIVLN